ncbi:ABC transporter substrate-binding protein [Nocardioides sp. KR10-350]|uniref:ABC transporter substrate-binding protein n=1 Tax=Nocardioides cheoyonin TaxID=3156615 RepID=UPI0032B5FF25
MSVPITLACERYDRTEALRDGRVVPAGVDLTYLPQQVEETFFRMARFREFDAAEMSLSSYVLGLTREDPPFVAIPVFPSRFFRHSGIYVRADSPVTEPKQLAGGTVGIAEWQLTANVWIRGILADEYDLPVDAVSYRTGGLLDPGRPEKLKVELPSQIRLSPIDADQTLSAMLAEGEIDAIYSPRAPRGFGGPDAPIRRLFADSRAAEAEYFRRTRIFPTMHVVVLRRDVYERNRWLARSLYDAFAEAKRLAEENFEETAALRVMLPWFLDEADATRELMGPDFWAYGLEPNRHVLDTFLGYALDQGIAARPVTAEELFAPETLESTLV